MKKLNIAIITGGDVAERSVSLKSATTIFNNLDREKYQPYIIDFDGTNFIEDTTRAILDKNDFSLELDQQKIKFDVIFLAVLFFYVFLLQLEFYQSNLVYRATTLWLHKARKVSI